MSNPIYTTPPATSEVSVDSYMSLAEANTYVEANYLDYDIWNDATDTQKAIALNQGRARIDRQELKGERTETTQDYEFPRGGDTSVPTAIEEACADIAFTLIDGRNAEREFESLRVTKDKIAGVEVTYDKDTPMPHITSGILSIDAWAKIHPYLRNRNRVTLSRV